MTLLLLFPAALLVMLAERAAAVRRGVRIYDRRQTLSNLGCGALRLVAVVISRGLLLGAYFLVERNCGWLDLAAYSPFTWLFAVVAYDFVYYWVHRASHRWRVLWAVHAVHHQPSRFNLSLGFRAGLLGPVVSAPFFLALAVLGVPTIVYATVGSIVTAVMFFQHARFVPSLGFLERVLNTPSHHRAHHSSRPALWDKNFGGLLIVWDRWFGTFEEEGGEAGYDGDSRVTSLGPIRANFEPWRDLWNVLRAPGSRPSTRRIAQASLVSVAAVAIALALARNPLHPLLLVALAAPALLLADLGSGVVHWMFDRHVPRDRGVFRAIAADFDEHHERPLLVVRADFVYSASKSALAALPLATVAYFGTAVPVAAALLAWTAGVVLFAPELHKLAHRRPPNDAVRVLQAWGVVLSPRSHARHHRGDHRDAYCVVTGWCNPALDRWNLWRRLDGLLVAARGVRAGVTKAGLGVRG